MLPLDVELPLPLVLVELELEPVPLLGLLERFTESLLSLKPARLFQLPRLELLPPFQSLVFESL